MFVCLLFMFACVCVVCGVVCLICLLRRDLRFGEIVGMVVFLLTCCGLLVIAARLIGCWLLCICVLLFKCLI